MDEHTNTKRKPYGIIITIVLVIAAILAASFFILRERIEKIELQIVEDKTNHFLSEIKEGYISENNLDLPVFFYDYFTKNWEKLADTLKTYGIMDEDSIRDGWNAILTSMEYSIDDVQKVDGAYAITITVSNKNFAHIMKETASDLTDNKLALFANMLTGSLPDEFWSDYARERDTTTEIVSGTYGLLLRKTEHDEWQLQYDQKVLGSMAGLDDEYMEMFSKEPQTIVFPAE